MKKAANLWVDGAVNELADVVCGQENILTLRSHHSVSRAPPFVSAKGRSIFGKICVCYRSNH